MFDYLIVGAGFAGSVLAERLAAGSNKRVLVVDRRSHIGGNAFDHYNSEGLLIHRYGPHIFHTNSQEVFDYLSRFTLWRPYEHRVLACVDGQLVPIPINLDTVNRLYNLNLSSDEMRLWLEARREPVAHVRTSEDVVVSQVGRELYEKFFRGYTRKQWGCDASQLDAAVAARVPTRVSRDDRYFTDSFQAMPASGYTEMFARLLEHPKISVQLGCEWREAARAVAGAEVIFTGPVDEYFDYRWGRLPYRSLEFRHEVMGVERYQAAAVVNYPSEQQAYTRITEFKYLTGQQHGQTAVVYEHPRGEGDPYYPVPRSENAELYAKYKVLADEARGVHFVGRLATYKYYNMDQVVAQALTLYAKLSGMSRQEATKAIAVTNLSNKVISISSMPVVKSERPRSAPQRRFQKNG